MKNSTKDSASGYYLWMFSMTAVMLSCLSVFCIPEVINHIVGNAAAPAFWAVYAMPAAGLIFLCLAAFLRTKFKQRENITYIKALGRMLVLLFFFGCCALVLSLLNGLAAVFLYTMLKESLTLSQIKGIINVLATGIHLVLLPFFISVFWSEVAGGGFGASMAEGIQRGGRRYFRLFLVELAAFGSGFVLLTAYYDMPKTFGARLGQGVLLGAIGAAALAVSGQICLKREEEMGKKGRRFRTSISILLCTAVLADLFPAEVFAAEYLRNVDFSSPEAVTEMNEVTYKKDETLRNPMDYYREPEPEGALVAVDEYSKTYRTSETEFLTQIGGQANTYMDDGGETQMVDNTLVEKNPWFEADYFENAANDYTVRLPLEINEKNGVKLSKGGYLIEFIPQEGDFSRPVAAENAVLYNDVFEGIDYQYTILGDSIKEDIILNYAVPRHDFSFALYPGGLQVKEENGTIILYDTDASDPVYTMIAPEMSDASGNVSLNVTLSLTEAEGQYLVTVHADEAWLNSPDCAYPVRIDPTINVSDSSIGLYGVEQGSADIVMGDNNYPYCGYDDGITSKNLQLFGKANLMTRTYVAIGYDFSQISAEAKVDNATFSLYHYTNWSKGGSNFGLYQVNQPWDPARITWNNQLSYSHTFIQYQPTNGGRGWMNWDVTEVVNSWIQGMSANNGFVVKAEDERNMQAEVFHNKNGANQPVLTINWSIPDPVDPAYPLDDTSIVLRPMTEKDTSGMLLFDAVFADGVATPGAVVNYCLSPDNLSGASKASASYKYPDSTAFETIFPNGTRYKDKQGNYQTMLYAGLGFDKIYQILAQAEKDGLTSAQVGSDTFLIYEIKDTDTFPYIATHYGVPLDTIMRDNKVQDTLVVENNTIFIRNPRTGEAYNQAALSDDAKRAIDSALMGRGLHCEYGFEPVNLSTGNYYFSASDAVIPDLGGDFSIERSYNSKDSGSNSMFGRGWNFVYEESLSRKADGRILYSVGDGKTLVFTPDGAGGYRAPSGYYYTLKQIPETVVPEDGTDPVVVYRWELYEADGSYRKFNTWGLLTELVDTNGLVTTIQYGEDFRMKSITSPSGKVYDIVCDSRGRITSVTLPNSAVLRYTYDSEGNLVNFQDANGNTVRYDYDQDHRMKAWYDQEGNRIALNEYDNQGRVVKQTDANGKVSTLAYTDSQTVATDANGNVTRYALDDQYRITRITYPDGRVEKRSYDSANNLVADGDYTYTYDGSGNMLTETRKDGAIRSYVYNSKNQITRVTDFDGTVTRMEYSAEGDLIRITYGDGVFESYVYDGSHRMISHTNAGGNTETFTYSGAVVREYKDYKGNRYQLSYNAMNQLTAITAPDGTVTRRMYDAAGVQTGEQAADGAYTAYTLDKIGNPIRVTDPMGYASDFIYDGMYRITKAVDPQGNSVAYTYDGNGNTLTETDGEGNVTAYEYDSMNRVVKRTEPGGVVTRYTYDLYGNLTETVYPNGKKETVSYDTVLHLPIKCTDVLNYSQTYAYDKAGRLTRLTYADGTFLSYEYDKRGRVARFTDETGLVSEFSYDREGNILSLTENGSRVYRYQYDKNGNLEKATDPLGGTVTYEYDALNRQVKTINEAGAVTSYTYDAVGRVVAVTDALKQTEILEYDRNGSLTQVTMKNGGKIQYHYDAAGNLISEKDPLGNITNYTYDKIQRLVSVTNALGGVQTYTYDSAGNLKTVTDAQGDTASVVWDKMGNPVAVTLENGDTTRFTYSAKGQVLISVDAAGLKTEYQYDSMGRVTEMSDNTDARLTYAYDRYGRLISRTDVLGRSETYQYDSFSQIVRVTGMDGNASGLSYDALGRLLSVTDAEDKTTVFAYDAMGNLVKQTGADGKVYAYAYDPLNRVTKATNPQGGEVLYGYDSQDNLIFVTDENGITTGYAYDLLNRLTESRDGRGGTTAYGYDALSRIISLTEPGGGVTEYRYDAVGNLTKLKNANGYITEFAYDSAGNQTKAIFQKGAEITYTYDKHNNMTSRTDALGNVTAYEVDLNGLITKITQPNGGEYAYRYDAGSRLTGVTTPNGYEIAFSYDDYGNLAEETDNVGRTIRYAYDVMHRITRVTGPDGNVTSYDYDSSGNLSRMVGADGAATSYTYNLLNQVTSETDPEGKVTKLQYDPAGNVTSVTGPGGGTTSFSYDKNYNLASVTDPMGYVTKAEYDKDNRLITATDPMGRTEHYEYDALGQVVKATDSSGGTVQYAYDAHGNVTKLTNQLGGVTEFTYDLADRLVRVTDPQQRETAYTYDSMGNLLGQKDADGKETTYTYDLEGNRTSLTDPEGRKEEMAYDLRGNLVLAVRPDSTRVSYDYDELNRLVSKAYSEAAEERVCCFYDAMGNRISMEDKNGETTYGYDLLGRMISVTSADGKEVSYTYDGAGNLGSITYADGRVVSYTYDRNGRLTGVSDDGVETVYTYDALGRVTETLRPGGTRTVYTYDEKGNLTGLVNWDSDGELISSFAYTYDAQGYIIAETAQDGERTVERSYEYNSSGELIRFTEQEGLKTASYTYAYDASGNRVELKKEGGEHPETITYTYNRANQLTASESTIEGRTTYDYNENGSLILEQTEGKQEVTYEYTVEQRLAAVREGGALLMAAAYDGDGNRIFTVSGKETEQYTQKERLPGNEETPAKEGAEDAPMAEGVSVVGIAAFAEAVMAGGIRGTGEMAFGEGSVENLTGDVSGLEDTGTPQAEVHTYQEKQYADPEESIFWYGFGQAFLQFSGGMNTAVSAYLSDWFCSAWDYVTGQYELELYSESVPGEEKGPAGVEPGNGFSQADIEAMQLAGLSEKDIAAVMGVEEKTAPALPGGSDGTGEELPEEEPEGSGQQGEAEPPADGENAELPADRETTEPPSGGEAAVPPEDRQPSQGGSVVIPENPSQEKRRDYELTYYVNDVNTENTQVLMEYGRRGELKNTYTYGLERLSVNTDDYLYDGRGSVSSIITAAGEMTASYTYDPFGNVTSGAPEFDSFYGYNGEETNPLTGRQYLRARYYDAGKGRFDVADTYLGNLTEPLTQNRYSYTVNNPVMRIDPSGHWPGWLDKAADTAKKGANAVTNQGNSTAAGAVKNIGTSARLGITKAAGNQKGQGLAPIGNTAYRTLETITQKAQQGLQIPQQIGTATYRQTQTHIGQQVAELKQHVISFACGDAKKLAAGAGIAYMKTRMADPMLELFGVLEGTFFNGDVPVYQSMKSRENDWMDSIDSSLGRGTNTSAYELAKAAGARWGEAYANSRYQNSHRAGTRMLRNLSVITDKLWMNTTVEEQYNSNYEKEMSQLHTDASGNEKWEPITNQGSLDYLDFGPVTASYSACETIAVYNALVKSDQNVPLSDVMRQAQTSNATMLSGKFGTDPYEIGGLLSHYGLDYETIDSQADLSQHNQKGDLMIVSMWNNAYNVDRQLHTFLIEADDSGTYTSYNRISDTVSYQRETMDVIIGEGRFVYGYYIKK